MSYGARVTKLPEVLDTYQRWRGVHARIVQVLMAMAGLHLPAYTLLEIVLAMDDMEIYPYARVANVVLKVDKAIKGVKRMK